MRVAIVGAGGVGGYFGARLAAAGQDVTFVARGAHLAAMRTDGLRLTSPLGDLVVNPVQVTDDPGSVGSVDVVLVAVKTWQLDAALPGIQPLLGGETMVVPTLNGVEAADRLADALGSHHVAIGTARIIAHISAPGHIRHIGAEPTLVFGERTNERTARAERFRDAVREAGMAAEIPADVNVALWQKFLFVVPVGEVGAVTRVPLGLIRDNPESRSLLEGAMREIEVLARARGVALPDDVVSRSLQFADGLPADAIASLHRDLEDGRRSELEAWTGAVVRLARAAGVAAPIHDVLYAALIPLERRACGDLPAA